MLDLFKKLKTQDCYTETTFECKRGGLTIRGTKDSMVNPDYSRQAQRAYPNAKLHLIEGGAHGFSKKHDAIAIAHLRRFLER